MLAAAGQKGLDTARQGRQWDYNQLSQYPSSSYGGGGYQAGRAPAASYVIGVQQQPYGVQQQSYGVQQQQYGVQSVPYSGGLYPAAQPSQTAAYDPYQAVASQPQADMAMAGTHQYAAYPVPVPADQYTSADSSYGSYAPAPAPSYGPPSYGGGGGGGYGHGGGGYDNSPALSALALLGFLFLLNLIQQTLNNNNTGGTGTGGTGRGGGGGSPAWEEALSAAELEMRLRGALLDGVQWRELAEDTASWLSRVQHSKRPGTRSECLRSALCQMNHKLGHSFGLIGRLVAKLTRWYVLSAERPLNDQGSVKASEYKDSECLIIHHECE